MSQHGDVLVQEDDGVWVMTGEIDAAVQSRCEDLLVDAASRAEHRLVIDLSAVTFMDSGGLRLLYHAAERSPEPPLLRGVPAHILDLLELSGVAGLFTVEQAEPVQ